MLFCRRIWTAGGRKGRVMRFGIMAAFMICAAAACSADEDTCGAGALSPLLNQPLDQVEGQLPEQARILPPDSVMTQDFRPDRVNVDLDEDGVIIRLWCG